MPDLDVAVFDRLLCEIGWSRGALAAVLGIQELSIRRWVNGENRVPPNLLPWLEILAAAHREHPVPRGWDEPPEWMKGG